MKSWIPILFFNCFVSLAISQNSKEDNPEIILQNYLNGNHLNDIGRLYLLTKNCTTAVDIFQQMLEELKTSPAKQQDICNGEIYNLLGSAYLCSGEPQKALEYFNKGLDIRLKYHSIQSSNSYSNIGLASSRIGKHREALKNHRQALSLFKDLSIDNGIANELNNIGDVYYQLQLYDSALIFYDRSFSKAEEINSLEMLMDNHNDLAKIYSNQKKYSKSSEHFKKSFVLSRKLIQVHTMRLLDTQIALKNEKQEDEKRLLINEIRNRKYKQYGLSIILFLIMLSSVILFFNFYNFKKRKLAEEQKLINEIKLLRTKSVIHKSADQSTSKEISKLDKKMIDRYTNGKINETQWKILEIIYQNPTITYAEIADRIFISNSGLKSAFKKLYLLFSIDSPTRNKQLALVIKLTKIIQGGD